MTLTSWGFAELPACSRSKVRGPSSGAGQQHWRTLLFRMLTLRGGQWAPPTLIPIPEQPFGNRSSPTFHWGRWNSCRSSSHGRSLTSALFLVHHYSSMQQAPRLFWRGGNKDWRSPLPTVTQLQRGPAHSIKGQRMNILGSAGQVAELKTLYKGLYEREKKNPTKFLLMKFKRVS